MADYIEREAASAECGFGVSKIKTPFAQIIVGDTADKPYYSIMWWDTAKKECYIGYSSFTLDYVFKWLKEEFEITEEDADVAPVVHGRWEFDGSDFADIWKCSACGEDWYFEYDPRGAETRVNYCPNCGAHMKDGDT